MSTYLEILRLPRMALLLAATLVVRLPIGINALAVVLFLRAETGSFSLAGAVAGGLALGTGVGAPFMGRLVDRLGSRLLIAVAVGNAVALCALVLFGRAGAPGGVLVATALLAGALFPPNPSVLRARLPEMLGHDARLIPSAYALDSVLLETAFVGGPLLTAALVATVSPEAALLFSAAVVVAGTIAFQAALPPAPEGPARRERADAGVLGPLRAPGIQTLVVSMLPVGFALGALEVALPAFAEEEAAAELAGVLLAVWAIGSAVGGLVYGTRPRRSSLAALHLRLTLLLPLALVPLLVPTSIALMAVLLLPAGMLIAPIFATRNELAAFAAPPGMATEALTWPMTALISGVAAGAAVAGSLIDALDWRAAVAAAVIGALGGSLLSASRRRTLAAVPA